MGAPIGGGNAVDVETLEVGPEEGEDFLVFGGCQRDGRIVRGGGRGRGGESRAGIEGGWEVAEAVLDPAVQYSWVPGFGVRAFPKG